MAQRLLDLARVFAALSLLSFGGGSASIAEMQRQVVAHQWLAPRDFLDLYAIARAAPGPGMQLVTLVGWRVAGAAGAVVASLAMFLPAGLLVYGVTTLWRRLPDSRWKRALLRGMAPLAVGLTLASALSLVRSSAHPLRDGAVACICAALLLNTRLSPLLLLAAAGAGYLMAG